MEHEGDVELLLPLLNPIAEMEACSTSLVEDLSVIWRLCMRIAPKPTLVDDMEGAARLVQLHISRIHRATTDLASFFVAISRLIDSNDDPDAHIPHILAHYDDFLQE